MSLIQHAVKPEEVFLLTAISFLDWAKDKQSFSAAGYLYPTQEAHNQQGFAK